MLTGSISILEKFEPRSIESGVESTRVQKSDLFYPLSVDDLELIEEQSVRPACLRHKTSEALDHCRAVSLNSLCKGEEVPIG
jgi:hypothetical protein